MKRGGEGPRDGIDARLSLKRNGRRAIAPDPVGPQEPR